MQLMCDECIQLLSEPSPVCVSRSRNQSPFLPLGHMTAYPFLHMLRSALLQDQLGMTESSSECEITYAH